MGFVWKFFLVNFKIIFEVEVWGVWGGGVEDGEFAFEISVLVNLDVFDKNFIWCEIWCSGVRKEFFI